MNIFDSCARLRPRADVTRYLGIHHVDQRRRADRVLVGQLPPCGVLQKSAKVRSIALSGKTNLPNFDLIRGSSWLYRWRAFAAFLLPHFLGSQSPVAVTITSQLTRSRPRRSGRMCKTIISVAPILFPIWSPPFRVSRNR